MNTVPEGTRVRYRSLFGSMDRLSGQVRIVGPHDEDGGAEMLAEDGEVMDYRKERYLQPDVFWTTFEPVDEQDSGRDYTELANELDVLGQGTPQWAMPEAIGAGADAIRDLQKRLADAEATLERVRLAGREIVLTSMHGKTIINDGGIMQDDAQKIAEALRGRAMDEDTEGQHTLYAEVGFLTEEEAR